MWWCTYLLTALCRLLYVNKEQASNDDSAMQEQCLTTCVPAVVLQWKVWKSDHDH